MAEKEQSKFSVPAYTGSEVKQVKKRKTVFEKAMNKKSLDKSRNHTRVNIGVAFQRWRQLRDLKGLKSDSMMALFLLDSYEKDISTSTPSKTGLTRPPPPVSTIVAESLSDRYQGDALHITSTPIKHQMTTHPIPALSSNVGDSSSDRDDDFEEGLGCREVVETPIQVLETSIDWAEDRTWAPAEDTRDVSTSEEEVTIEEGSDYDDSDDEDYIPPLWFRTCGAIQQKLCLDAPQVISVEDTVHDTLDPEPIESQEIIKVQSPMEENEDIGEENHHVKTEEKTPSQTESISLKIRDKKCFICHQCLSSFTRQEDLQEHMNIHTGETLHECDQCWKTFVCASSLKSHLRVHSQEKPYLCSLCGKSFKYKPSLENHTRVHTGEKPFTCDQCGKSFRQSSNLQDHMYVHTGGKKYECDQCGRIFSRSKGLKSHMLVHSQEKPHSCSLCGKRFSRLHSLKLHQKIHTGERDHKCFECGKSFITAIRLKLHWRTHTGEKPYKCSHCDKRFRRSEHVKTHERIHTGEKPYHCTPCEKSFTQISNLHSHIKYNHSK